METIADKSRTKEIIEKLVSIIDTASPVPLASGKVMIYKDEVSSLLSELATQMDMEIKTYHEVNDRRGKIINEAKREAERIIYQAENTASRMRVNKRTTNVDPVDFSMLSQEELDELDNANEIYGASLIYTDEMLTEVSNLITETYESFKNDYSIILESMEEKIKILSDNKAELMNGLSEMDGKDRSQQIIEIGQLLSNELFNARMNSHRNPDMYDDGSMQLTFDLKTEQEMKAIEAEEQAREARELAREAEEAAKEAEEALAQMTAQRDALMEEVSKMKQDVLAERNTMTESIESESAKEHAKAVDDDGAGEELTATKEDAEPDEQSGKSSAITDDPAEDEEYEIVYVTEDELEEGEEYEVVYVDEDELEDGEEYEIEYVDEDKTVIDAPAGSGEGIKEVNLAGKPDDKQDRPEDEVSVEDSSDKPAPKREKVSDKADESDNEASDDELTVVPMIPHFVKSQKIATVPSEKVAKMASAITTDKKYSGLISKAVTENERIKTEKPKTGAGDYSDMKIAKKPDKNKVHEADMYVQEQFEITEF